MSKLAYGILGFLIASITNIVINLLSAAIQQKVFSEQFSNQSMWLLVGCLAAGFFISFWLNQEIVISNSYKRLPEKATDQVQTEIRQVSMSRLKALFSYGKLKGKGIRLTDIILIGSRIDIDTD